MSIFYTKNMNKVYTKRTISYIFLKMKPKREGNTEQTSEKTLFFYRKKIKNHIFVQSKQKIFLYSCKILWLKKENLRKGIDILHILMYNY